MSELIKAAARAKGAARALAIATTEEKNEALRLMADALMANTHEILRANALDIESERAKGTGTALLDRLTLTEARIADMAEGVRKVAALPDPIGDEIESWTVENGLNIRKVRVPIGVIGMIYEARPNVTVDSAALTLKSGNTVLLRGSGSALNSNKALVNVIKDALAKSKLPPECVELVTDPSRESANEMMRLTEYLDLLIPRGGAGLIKSVVENAKVPVMETGVGNCHIYVDATAEKEMTEALVINAKTQRPAVCNAAETLLISRDYPYTDELIAVLKEKGVTLHGDNEMCERYGAIPATEQDYTDEYLSLDMCVKTVDGVGEAIAHIARYGTGHTELIISENMDNVRRFQAEVDAACVNHNASTRFTDGGQFGFGAEIGIATQKMHARGPLGLRELTIYKYLVNGKGQIRQ